MSKHAVVVWPNEKVYFFKGSEYIRYDIAADAADEGYPQPIATGWPGVFDRDIDAVVVWPNEKVYFFKGSEYIRYDIAADAADEGYPQPIATGWPGVFDRDIDAVVVWANEKVYFFKGSEYIRYDIAADAADEGYPQPIATGWPGVFDRDIDAVVVWANEKVYFFKGSEYIRYDIAADAADEGYPQPIATGWPGVFDRETREGGEGAGSGGTHASVRDRFIAFSEPFEGRVHWMYLDVRGKATTAVGNLIDIEDDALKLPFTDVNDSGSRADPTQIREEWHAVKQRLDLASRGHTAFESITRLRLTDDAIDQLVLSRFDRNDQSLRAAFPDWSTWPSDAQLGAHSIAWAGAHFPRKWMKFNAAAAAHDWTRAADESHLDETDNLGLRARNEANRTLFTNAAVVEEAGLPKSRLVYPGKL